MQPVRKLKTPKIFNLKDLIVRKIFVVKNFPHVVFATRKMLLNAKKFLVWFFQLLNVLHLGYSWHLTAIRAKPVLSVNWGEL